MTRPSFDPFSTDLDRNGALRILRDAVAGADDGELFLERSQQESLVFDDGRLRNSSFMAGRGFGLRAVIALCTPTITAPVTNGACIPCMTLPIPCRTPERA